MSALNIIARSMVENGTARFELKGNDDGTFSVIDRLNQVEAWQLQKRYSHKNAVRKAVSMEIQYRTWNRPVGW